MEQPIKHSEIIQPGNPFEETLKGIEQVIAIIKGELKAAMQELLKMQERVNISSKSGREDIKKAIPVIESYALEQRELNKIEQQTAQIKAKINVALTQESKDLVKVKDELNKLNNATKEELRLNQAADGSLNKLRAELKKLTIQFDNADAEMRKKLLPSIQKLNKNILDVEKTTGRAQRNVGNYASAIQGLRLKVVAAAAAVAGLIRIAGQSVKAYDQEAKAQKSLEVALGKTSKELLAQASALQKATIYGDESIVQGQAFLAQMGATEKQIKKLTPVVLDFAAAKGIDLKTAFDLVAKSVFSSTNALSRYGITIEGTAGSTGRINQAVGALTKNFKGQAVAATAGAGAFQQFANVISDIQEKIGGFIAKIIGPFIKGLGNLISGSKSHSEALILEKMQINNLIAAITNANTGQEARNALIAKLQKEYPDFLKNLDTEKVTNQELRDRLIEVNKQYEERIKLAVQEELVARQAAQIADSLVKEVELIQLLNSTQLRLARTQELISKSPIASQDLLNAEQFELNQIEKITGAIEDQQKMREELNKSNEAAIALLGLNIEEIDEIIEKGESLDEQEKKRFELLQMIRKWVEESDKKEAERKKSKLTLEEQMRKWNEEADNKEIEQGDFLLQRDIKFTDEKYGAIDKANKDKEASDKQYQQFQQASMQKGLAGLDEFAKERGVILNTSLLADQIRGLSATIMALTVGEANTAKVGFPWNIPLMIGFAGQVAGLLSTIRSIKIGGTKYEGGGSGVINDIIERSIIERIQYATGGSGELSKEGKILTGERHHSGGVNLGAIGEAERGEYFGIVNRPMTQRYRDDLPQVFETLNKGTFHNVFTRANEMHEIINRTTLNQDPYTKKMYGLMKKQPAVYSDSEGNQVLLWPTGKKRVIKTA